MKNILLGLLLTISGTAFAEHHEGNFEDHKKKALEHLDEKLKALQDHKTCVSGATDNAGLKGCHEKMKAMRKELKEDFLEHRKERIDKKLEKLKDKK